MRVLFLYLRDDGSAYAHRMGGLRRALDLAGAETTAISLRELRYGRPILAHALGARSVRHGLGDVDFIHAGGDASFAAAFLKKRTNAKIIADIHGDTLREAQMIFGHNRNAKNGFQLAQARITNPIYYRTSDYYLAVSEPSIERLRTEHRIAPDRIGLVRNGVDLELFRPADYPVLRQPDQPLRVAYAGRFDPWQGVDNLVDGFSLVDGATAHLTVIGFSARDAAVRATFASRLGEHCDLVDMLSPAALISRLHDADALVIPRTPHPAVEVALPTKFAEYLALGKPLIVCDVDETAELVRSADCGFVCEPTPQGLAAGVREAASASPDRLIAMGKNARRLAEANFGWPEIGAAYLETLRRWYTP